LSFFLSQFIRRLISGQSQIKKIFPLLDNNGMPGHKKNHPVSLPWGSFGLAASGPELKGG